MGNWLKSDASNTTFTLLFDCSPASLTEEMEIITKPQLCHVKGIHKKHIFLMCE